MATTEVDDRLAPASDEDEARGAANEPDHGVDRLPELVAALVTYANQVERLHARMRFSADQGDRMMAQLGLPPAD